MYINIFMYIYTCLCVYKNTHASEYEDDLRRAQRVSACRGKPPIPTYKVVQVGQRRATPLLTLLDPGRESQSTFRPQREQSVPALSCSGAGRSSDGAEKSSVS